MLALEQTGEMGEPCGKAVATSTHGEDHLPHLIEQRRDLSGYRNPTDQVWIHAQTQESANKLGELDRVVSVFNVKTHR